MPCSRAACPGSPQDGLSCQISVGLRDISKIIHVSCVRACSQNTNRTCEECLRNVSCLWCHTNKACLDYPVSRILPPSSLCKLSSARWGVCWVNFEALIITLSVVGGAVLLAVAVCCCCCCCRRKKSRKPDKSEEKAAREREERRIRQEERRAEMKSRHDEIRKKYGLFKEENPYARFENN
ncbi:pituitary tumor-transforming gene 1 protein-interacting protein isoform X2 [Canis lupus baileyi]|uniref:pituitary tumor-transforming gene 1 protein-interacting protein isoform X2 n=1 Tax=Canis lupus dingo TaxID=286419 RepID=UPI0020C49387|nr:pituitary tumor-transforming gene 1 protein-interacting protein isoform X2 [Canis lupus dingo]